jgi:hypothetical protein
MGSLCLVGALTSVRADSLNTSGTICQAYNAANAKDIDYTVNGVWSRGAAARQIACAVPLSGSGSLFIIDGYNNAGTCTSCMITLYHFGGAEAASQPIWHCASGSSPPTWMEFVWFSTAVKDYARVICTLPANHAGTIFGIRSIPT